MRGSGTQVVKFPPRRSGSPSAPGNVPKYESNDRFSCMITTTCLIRWIPWWLASLTGSGLTIPALGAPDRAGASGEER